MHQSLALLILAAAPQWAGELARCDVGDTWSVSIDAHAIVTARVGDLTIQGPLAEADVRQVSSSVRTLTLYLASGRSVRVVHHLVDATFTLNAIGMHRCTGPAKFDTGKFVALTSYAGPRPYVRLLLRALDHSVVDVVDVLPPMPPVGLVLSGHLGKDSFHFIAERRKQTAEGLVLAGTGGFCNLYDMCWPVHTVILSGAVSNGEVVQTGVSEGTARLVGGFEAAGWAEVQKLPLEKK